MNKLRNNPFIATQLCSLLLGMVFIVASAQAQAPAAAANDNRSNATRVQAFAPRYRLSLMPAGFRLMPTTSTRTGVGSRSTGISLMPMAAVPNLQVMGGGTLGRLTKWTGFTSSNSSIGDSTIFEDKFGNVGIGTDTPTSRLTVNGTIQASGGVSIIHDTTLTGNGTAAMPLGVSVPLILNGSSPFPNGVIQATNSALFGRGVVGNGGAGGPGVQGRGGPATGTSAPGNGVVGGGGESSDNNQQGGTGVVGTGGGNTGGGEGGVGVFGRGGQTSGTRGGTGVFGQGAEGAPGVLAEGGLSGSSADGGGGLRAFGGQGSGIGKSGGIGVEASGGIGVNGATPGLAGKFNGDVQITGNTLVTSAGNGIILKSPDGATCRLLSIDNAGSLVLTAITCP